MSLKKRLVELAALAFVSAAAVACSSSSGGQAESPGVTDDAVTACDAVDLATPTDGVQLKIALPLEAGQEREVCQLVKLDDDINVNWSEGRFTKGSHHALTLRSTYTDTIPATTLDGQTLDGTQVHTCSTPSALWSADGVVAGGDPVGNAAATGSLAQGTYPPDVAMKLKKGQYMIMNFHMLNTTTEKMTSCYKVNLHGIPAEQVAQEGGILFYYNPFITVPASGTATARMSCPMTQDITLAGAVSHGHKRLDGYTSRVLSSDPAAGGTEVRKLYEGTEWDTPTPIGYTPPLSLTKGQYIDYQCHYTNAEARNVAQGFQTTDEMCMFVGAYWPRDQGLENCQGTADLPQRFFGSGDKNGSDFISCLMASPGVFTGGGPASSDDRYASLGCVTQTCAKASAGISALFNACSDMSSPACQTAGAAMAAATCD